MLSRATVVHGYPGRVLPDVRLASEGSSFLNCPSPKPSNSSGLMKSYRARKRSTSPTCPLCPLFPVTVSESSRLSGLRLRQMPSVVLRRACHVPEPGPLAQSPQCSLAAHLPRSGLAPLPLLAMWGRSHLPGLRAPLPMPPHSPLHTWLSRT